MPISRGQLSSLTKHEWIAISSLQSLQSVLQDKPRNEGMALIEKQDPQVPIATQAEMLSINRTGLYYKPREVSELTLFLRRRIDEIHTFLPGAGSRGIRDLLRLEGIRVNRKAIQHHLQDMGITVIYTWT